MKNTWPAQETGVACSDKKICMGAAYSDEQAGWPCCYTLDGTRQILFLHGFVLLGIAVHVFFTL
jgi:hypothetical protein